MEPIALSPAAPPNWQKMQTADLDDVEAIAAGVHPDFPEDRAVFAERLRLHPDGCWMLRHDGVAVGYVLSHPWTTDSLPALNARLGALPKAADTYYIHDLALLPAARGGGAARAITERLVTHAAALGLPIVTLVAVNGSVPFWSRLGFEAEDDPRFRDKLRSYADDARLMRRPTP